ncbi:hypothetical protein SORBI_3003G232500 [Sorghum bicolor]|uniref:Uncharacterized protein n=2 Tax=Sorghum bicolor TaxID=4558 RepID=A0A1B6Q4W7_SORBI|nr:hypothetical protein SORBI_3003G232500 [Sorghum bicolor]
MTTRTTTVAAASASAWAHACVAVSPGTSGRQSFCQKPAKRPRAGAGRPAGDAGRASRVSACVLSRGHMATVTGGSVVLVRTSAGGPNCRNRTSPPGPHATTPLCSASLRPPVVVQSPIHPLGIDVDPPNLSVRPSVHGTREARRPPRRPGRLRLAMRPCPARAVVTVLVPDEMRSGRAGARF